MHKEQPNSFGILVLQITSHCKGSYAVVAVESFGPFDQASGRAVAVVVWESKKRGNWVV